MSDCCSGFLAAADHNFGAAAARADLDRFRREGLIAPGRSLRDGVLAQGGIGSVLDIGAGVGGLSFELLAAGAARATLVDAAPAYAALAMQEAARRQVEARIVAITGDAVAVAERLPRADAVVLDRVVCCYPSFAPLLAVSISRAERLFAFSYPHDRWYMHLADLAQNRLREWRGNPFRTFMHDPAAMRAQIARAGFQLASRRTTLAWCIEVHVAGGVPSR